MDIVTVLLLGAIIVVAIVLLFSPPLRRSSSPFVTVLSTGNPALLALSKSILEDAEIPFVANGEGVQDLFGLGRIGPGGYNLITGPARIQVPLNYEKEARVLLSDIETSYNQAEEPPPGPSA